MSPALARLYQRVILEHHAHPRNAGPLPGATHEARADNPLCGDRITLRLQLAGDRIVAAAFEGDGCAIAIASASLLTARITGQGVGSARALDDELRKLLAPGPPHEHAARDLLGDLVALEGTRDFPSRVRCATLAWDAMLQALDPMNRRADIPEPRLRDG